MKVGDGASSKTSQVFNSSLEILYAMLKFVKEQALLAKFNHTIISKIELAAEEALVNIINHGYPHIAGTIEIICDKSEKNGLKIILIDQGIPFNPLEAIKNFQPGNIESEEEENPKGQLGGYGIYFIVNMMDSVDYERVENNNVLTLIKYLEE